MNFSDNPTTNHVPPPGSTSSTPNLPPSPHDDDTPTTTMNEPPPTGQLPLPEFSLPFRPHRPGSPPPATAQASQLFSLLIHPNAALRNPAYIDVSTRNEATLLAPTLAPAAADNNSKNATQWVQYGGMWHQAGSFAVVVYVADPNVVTPVEEDGVLDAVVGITERGAVAQAINLQQQSRNIAAKETEKNLEQPKKLSKREKRAQKRRQAEAGGKDIGMKQPRKRGSRRDGRAKKRQQSGAEGRDLEMMSHAGNVYLSEPSGKMLKKYEVVS
ncbi:hypothetical protein BU16DRAFT_562541 [Lophium mytilinum]|uniref:Uncharacterized protein n=1 Tax=Lophium mytilinum TaxID=390894 RepID=A0A6A6QRZ8_9PEZI|nr:hypothetical protein BU16DRAFT_562541 [Lophium mytilinum]